MDDQQGAQEDWSEVVSEASHHVHARRAAIEEAEDLQKPRSRVPVLAAVGALLVAVLAWDAYVLLRPPDVPEPAVEAANLRYFVADAVDLVEGFRAAQGRLPTRADLGDLLDEEISYEVSGDRYTVGARGEGASVEYDSRVPLRDWMASGTANIDGGGTP